MFECATCCSPVLVLLHGTCAHPRGHVDGTAFGAAQCLADEQGYIYVPALLEIATTRGSEVLVSKEISDIAKKLNRAKVTRLTPYELASWCLNPKATFTQRKNSISHR